MAGRMTFFSYLGGGIRKNVRYEETFRIFISACSRHFTCGTSERWQRLARPAGKQGVESATSGKHPNCL